MTDLRALEYPTFRVPYELLNKRFRSAQKTIDREVSHVTQACVNVEKVLQRDDGANVQIVDLQPAIQTLLQRLDTLRSKCTNVVNGEMQSAANIKQRVEHLKVCVDEKAPQASLDQWKRARIDRLLMDYLLRAGYYRTAEHLASRHGLEHLSNADIYIQANQVADALMQCQTQPCLDWCHDNKSKLRRLQSRLELHVREQEFIELIRAGQRNNAVAYAKKWFANVDKELWNAGDLRRIMGLLAYPCGSTPVYASLMDDSRWQTLKDEFWKEFDRVYQLSRWSVFSACLQSGLSALKTPQCTPTSNGSSSCPVCRSDVHMLAQQLPYAHAAQSRLVCHVTQQRLNENNPPMMLPNGYVYGSQTLETMAWQNDGKVVCPRSGEEFSIEQAVRAYVM